MSAINLNNKSNVKKEESAKKNSENTYNNINNINNDTKGNELNIKLNISMDNCNANKYKSDKKIFLDEIIDEYEFNELNRKDNNTTSNKKESSFYFSNQNIKTIKNSLKYTKAQCINSLLQNNNNNKNFIDNKHQ
jgi:hypothetical protein